METESGLSKEPEGSFEGSLDPHALWERSKKLKTVIDLQDMRYLASYLGTTIDVAAESLGISESAVCRWNEDIPVRAVMGTPYEQLDNIVELKILLDKCVPDEETRVAW